MKEKPVKGKEAAKADPTPDEVQVLTIDRWLSFRFAVIAARVGVISHRYSQQKFQLSGNSWRGLALLARFGPCSAKQLVEKSNFDYPKVSRLIEDLVDRQLVERKSDSKDQRRAELTLTQQGRQVYESIARRATEFEAYATATLTKSERAALWSAIEKIDGQIAKFFAQAASDEDE